MELRRPDEPHAELSRPRTPSRRTRPRSRWTARPDTSGSLDYVAAHESARRSTRRWSRDRSSAASPWRWARRSGEELIYENGRLVNPAYMHYALPRAADLPRVRPILIEDPDPNGPYGAKSIGELGIIPAAPAVANAVLRRGGHPAARAAVHAGQGACRACGEGGTPQAPLRIWRRPTGGRSNSSGAPTHSAVHRLLDTFGTRFAKRLPADARIAIYRRAALARCRASRRSDRIPRRSAAAPICCCSGARASRTPRARVARRDPRARHARDHGRRRARDRRRASRCAHRARPARARSGPRRGRRVDRVTAGARGRDGRRQPPPGKALLVLPQRLRLLQARRVNLAVLRGRRRPSLLPRRRRRAPLPGGDAIRSRDRARRARRRGRSSRAEQASGRADGRLLHRAGRDGARGRASW